MAIDIVDLVVERGRRIVLNGITLSILPGQITGLLGPSGSGKTTLLRAVVGVQVLKSGTITVLGQPAGSPDLRRRTGYMTQALSIYPDLTVAENVHYFGSLYGLPATAAESTISDVGLADEADRLVADLSGGQRARASLACCLVARPDLMILDEPTVGQDPLLREELWRRFQTLARAGTTMVVSSHVMDEADRCDRLILIRGGEILAHDTPAAVKAAGGTEDLDEAFRRLIQAKAGP